MSTRAVAAKNKFPCTACGACCKFAGIVSTFSEPTLPGTTQCVHLGRDNRCVVYKTRPKECRIINNFAENAKVCNLLQVMANVPGKFRLLVIDNN
jgi:Fe-S-cluster containining protein